VTRFGVLRCDVCAAAKSMAVMRNVLLGDIGGNS
jgi:hypothetical protein